ncbi:hypothetical protein DPMN_094597 [Dreissena polymorpha]|uniref:Uncharacterized protein n=1 Tax=Dreissena polymorpha TaxID=45954 RepID=A0A9D4L608_DREPO|nr:hypothetical protein DPMN_094597 [Dreissena polymorpha]
MPRVPSSPAVLDDDSEECSKAPQAAPPQILTGPAALLCPKMASQKQPRTSRAAPMVMMEQKVTIKLNNTSSAMHIRLDLDTCTFYIFLYTCSVLFPQSQVGASAIPGERQKEWELWEKNEAQQEMEEAAVSLKLTNMYIYKFIYVSVYIHSYKFDILHSFRYISTERLGRHSHGGEGVPIGRPGYNSADGY